MDDLTALKTFCSNPKKNHYSLTFLSPWVQRLLEDASKQRLEGEQEGRGIEAAVEAAAFFNPYPQNFKGRIHHLSNTCWMASSMWFTSGAEVYLNMLSSIPREMEINPVLRFLGENMTLNFESINKRPYVTTPTWDSVLGCVPYPEAVERGAQNDMAANFENILDVTPPHIRENLFCSMRTTVRSYVAREGGDEEMSEEEASELYSKLVSDYNEELEKVKEELRGLVKTGSPENIDVVLGPELSLSYKDDVPDVYYNKATKLGLWRTLYYLLTGEQDPKVISYERFCGLVGERSEPLNDSFCGLWKLYKDLRLLRGGILSEEVMNERYIYDVTASDGTAVNTEIERQVEPELLSQEGGGFTLVREKVFTPVMDRTYLIVQLKYDLNLETMEMVFPDTFEVSEVVLFEGVTFELASVGMKSGTVGRGHWWALLKDTDYEDRYVEYNDTSPSVYRDLEYINDMDEASHPVLLMYVRSN